MEIDTLLYIFLAIVGFSAAAVGLYSLFRGSGEHNQPQEQEPTRGRLDIHPVSPVSNVDELQPQEATLPSLPDVDWDNPFRDIVVDERERAQSLYRLIDESFSNDELRELCFEMDIDLDSLPGENKKAKARELVTYCRRHGRLEELTRRFCEKRPHLAGRISG